MTATTMRAARFDTVKRELTVADVPVPVPGPGEVLVKVEACGICLSDIHLIDGTLPVTMPVITPGHEIAGVIDSVGDRVPGWQPGDRVLLAGGRPCGQCASCQRGRQEECLDFRVLGFGVDGGWAQYVIQAFGALTPVPASVPLEQSAVLADAVSTPWAGLTERAQLKAGESVGLWGIGGLGVHAVQIARLIGAAPIIAIDPSAKARQRALNLGADVAVDPTSEDVNARVRELTGGRGLDVAVDLVGANAVVAQAVGCLARRGRCVMVGISMDRIDLGPDLPQAIFGVQSQSLLGHFGYRKEHLDQLVELVDAGRLDLSRSVSGVLPLDDINDGVRRLAEKTDDPIRLIVQPWA
jgi:D-arabinose 1-dehydrogenase-like Zn-dependent alcohol dehydrogenase